jgi:uncharacterized repeat protein (TIGR01451 family)
MVCAACVSGGRRSIVGDDEGGEGQVTPYSAGMCGARAVGLGVEAALRLAPAVGEISSFDAMSSLTSLPYNSHVFTTNDLIFFGYQDDTQLELYDSSGNPVSFAPNVLDRGQHVRVDTSQGVYLVGGSNKFAVLTGDAATNGVCGYYAMDAEGNGVSPWLYTYVPALYGHCEFVVFAYEDDTAVTVEQDSANGDYQPLASFSLNKGEHWSRSDLSNKYLRISADKPISALTSYDQSYFVPSADGNWSGTEFYTYVNDVETWAQDLTVIAYEDGTDILIKDSVSQETIRHVILNGGQAEAVQYAQGAEQYVTVLSNKTLAVAVQTWESQTYGYAQGVFVADRTGRGIGTEFIGTTLDDGYLYVLAYSDDTEVGVFDSQTGVWQASYSLDEGEAVNANPGSGLWKVVSNQPVSVHSGCGTHTAEFAPLFFNSNRVRLTKTADVEEGDCRSPGDTVTYTICLDNTGGARLADAYVIDFLPSGVFYPESVYTYGFAPNASPPIIIYPPDPAYLGGDHAYVWPLGDIDPDSSLCMEISVVATEDALPRTHLRNVAELHHLVSDPNGLNPVDVRAATAIQETLVCCWDTTEGVLYVDKNATGSASGVNWQDAFVEVQDALDRARTCGQAYSIYVTEGQYLASEPNGFELMAGMQLFGGFPTGGCDFERRDPQRHKTILTGRIDETHRNDIVVKMADNTLLDGFTITDAGVYGVYGNDVDFAVEHSRLENSWEYGLRAINGNVDLRWCTVANNQYDGILHEGQGHTLTVENSWCRQNGRRGLWSIGSTPVVRNSIVSESDMSELGNEGILMVNPTSSPVLQNLTVAHNKALGLGLAGTNLPVLDNLILYHNNADGHQFSGFGRGLFYYSCVYDPNDPNGVDLTPNEHFTISANPQLAFLDPNNVRIASVSPCRDAGNPMLNYYNQMDMDGRVRLLEAAVDMGAYEVNLYDLDIDGQVNMYEFGVLASVWNAHDPEDPAITDPEHPDHEYVTDPESPGYIPPAALALWDPDGERCNFAVTGHSQYAIDLTDLAAFVEGAPWPLAGSWGQEGESGEMMMSGGSGTLGLLSGFETTSLEVQALPYKSRLEQMGDLVTIIGQLETIWLDAPDVPEEIDAGDWQQFMEALYSKLVELYMEGVPIE